MEFINFWFIFHFFKLNFSKIDIYLKTSLYKKRFLIWGLGIGVWGLGIGDWGLGPIPNPQSPIPNPQTPIPNPHINKMNKYELIYEKFISVIILNMY
jgi:hypothetical protein